MYFIFGGKHQKELIKHYSRETVDKYSTKITLGLKSAHLVSQVSLFSFDNHFKALLSQFRVFQLAQALQEHSKLLQD